MDGQRKVLFVTGSIGKGKTTFLNNISSLLRRRWRADGFTCLPERRPSAESSADSYSLKLMRESSLYPWAKKNANQDGFIFNFETLNLIEEYFDDKRIEGLDVMVFDDLGFLEVSGQGFSPLFARSLSLGSGALVVGIKKQAISAFIEKFNLQNFDIIDLDQTRGRVCKTRLLRELSKMDAEDIGIFSSINGMIEVTVGSFLHAGRFPLKGYILVGIQNFFLILFSKELKGRGLYAISFISAAMKSFSPAGGRLKPMIYIFLQGLCFSLPISLFGHNFFSCLLGSFFIQVISLFFKFFAAYLTFGEAVFDSTLNLVNKLLTFAHLPAATLGQLLGLLLLLKLVLALGISAIAYFFDFSFLLLRWKGKIEKLSATKEMEVKSYSWKDSFLLAFKEMRLKRFLFPFILTLALIYFFSNLSAEGFAGIVIRAFVISWMALVLSRRVDFNKLIYLLNKWGWGHLADALKRAISLVQSFRERF